MIRSSRSAAFRRAGALAIALAIVPGAGLRAQQPALPVVTLNAGIHLIQAEVAGTHGSRTQGLMFRKTMAPSRGMLFIFPADERHCMWMKNTLIPLSVAFIDREGTILNVEDMTPHDETSHCAAGSARYALEMNQGWFAAKGIRPGTRLGGLDKAAATRP